MYKYLGFIVEMQVVILLWVNYHTGTKWFLLWFEKIHSYLQWLSGTTKKSHSTQNGKQYCHNSNQNKSGTFGQNQKLQALQNEYSCLTECSYLWLFKNDFLNIYQCICSCLVCHRVNVLLIKNENVLNFFCKNKFS